MRQKPKIRKSQGKAGICDFTGKTIYVTDADAKKGMTLIWGADPSADLKDMHTYRCERYAHYHVGHISAYQNYLERNGRSNQMPDLRGQTVSN